MISRSLKVSKSPVGMNESVVFSREATSDFFTTSVSVRVRRVMPSAVSLRTSPLSTEPLRVTMTVS